MPRSRRDPETVANLPGEEEGAGEGVGLVGGEERGGRRKEEGEEGGRRRKGKGKEGMKKEVKRQRFA